MAKTIVSATNKGGEGKTSLTISLSGYGAIIEKKKVLNIDLDPQGNDSGHYIPMRRDPAYKGGKIPGLHPDYDPKTDTDWKGYSSIADIFYGEVVSPYPTKIPNLEIMPAHSAKLQEAENTTANEVIEKVHLRLQQFINSPEIQAEYDYIIIDTPPSKGPLTIAALKAATHVIIPAQMEQFSMDGIYGMMQLWKQETYARSSDNPIHLVGILPNQVRDINLNKDFINDLKTTDGIKDYVIPFEIKKRAIYGEVLTEEANPKSIFQLPPSHVARQELEAVCQYIMGKVNHA